MRSLARRYPLVAFFGVTFLLTWAVWVPRALVSQDVMQAAWPADIAPLSTYGPALAAVIVAALIGRGALRDLGARLVRWRVGWWWYAVVLLGPAAFWAVVWALLQLLGWDGESSRPLLVEQGLVAALPLLLVLTLTDGLGEETGWRGFALPRLLSRHPALVASVVLGLLWALYHLPLFWTDGTTLSGSSPWVLAIELPAVAIVYTWVFLHTQGSALMAILLHGASNLTTMSASVAGGDNHRVTALVVLLKWLLAAAVVVAWRRNPAYAESAAREATPATARG
jgi:membrane protease YdiL (CAAX protease family)